MGRLLGMTAHLKTIRSISSLPNSLFQLCLNGISSYNFMSFHVALVVLICRNSRLVVFLFCPDSK